MEVTFKKASNGSAYEVLLDGVQIGSLIQTQFAYMAHMHGNWSGLRSQGRDLKAAQADVKQRITYARVHAASMLKCLANKQVSVKAAKLAFTQLNGIEIHKFNKEQFIKFLEEIAKDM